MAGCRATSCDGWREPGETVVSYDLMEPDAFLQEFLGLDGERVIFAAGDITDRDRLREVALQHGRNQHHQRHRHHAPL